MSAIAGNCLLCSMVLFLVLAGRSRFPLRRSRVIGEIPVGSMPLAAWAQIVARWISGLRLRCHRGVCHSEVARRAEPRSANRSEEHTSELLSPDQIVCRLLL